MTEVTNVAVPTPGLPQKKPSAKERGQMARRMFKAVRKEVGVALFMDILEVAAHAMLDDLEHGEVQLSELFGDDNVLMERREKYIEDALNEVVLDFFGIWTNSCDLCKSLTGVFDREMLEYFRLERQAQ